jgi:phage major head subunit gpT-like protein
MAYTFLDSRDLVAGFYPVYEQARAGAWADMLSFRVDSDRAIEEYAWLGMSSGMREWVGGRNEGTLNRFTLTVANKKYEDTLAIQLDDLRRDKTGQIRMRIADMAQKAADHPNALLAALINANPTCYDGQTFFSATHSEGSSGTQLNALTATQVPSANVVTPTAPTATEMANVLLETIGYMYGLVDDKGDPINGSARSFHVLAPTAPIWAAIQQATSSLNLVGGATNPVMGLLSGGISITSTFEPRLTTLATNSQIVVSITDGATKPFIHQVEIDLETQYLGAGSDEELKNDRHLFGLKSIRALAPGFWQKSARVTLS